MSKTIDIQIEKSKRLIEGLKRHMAEMESKGISMATLDDMNEQLRRLSDSARAADELRTKLSNQVRSTNNMLAACKQAYIATKAVIKNNYPQEQWRDYGVDDKR